MYYLLAAIYTQIQILPLTILLVITFRKDLRYPILNIIGGITFLTMAITGMTLLSLSPYNPVKNWFILLSTIVLVFSSLLFLRYLKFPFTIGLFIVIVFNNYNDTLELFSRYINIYESTKKDGLIYLVEAIRCYLIVLILTFPLLWLFFTKALKPVISNTIHLSFWRFLWIMPLIFFLIYRFSIRNVYWDSNSFPSNISFSLPFFWNIAMFLFYFFIMHLLSVITKNAKLEEVIHVADIQISMQKEQYELLKKNIEETKAARHDLRHHFLVIQGYINNKDLDSLTSYINNYISAMTPVEGKTVCENYAVNTILFHYITQCEENAVEITASINIPAILPIPDNDFCVILSNLLENALEACLRMSSNKPFITVNIGTAGKWMLLLTVKNSYEGSIRRKNGIFQSSKRNGEGIGISSVNNFVSKYHGISKYTYEEQLFSASILLNPSPTKAPDS